LNPITFTFKPWALSPKPFFIMRLGIDTGGTFTDFVLHTGDSIKTYKTSSTPDDPSRAIFKGLAHFFDVLPPDLEIIHGTTVGTNAFLERKGARTVLITTHGFADILIIGRQNRRELYNLEVTRSPAIIPSSLITTVKERMRFDGSVKIPLRPSVGRRLRSFCRRQEAESVAVCLLHSYANPVHERTIKEQLAGLQLPVTLSSDILPEFREYERLTTTLINGYLAPVISSYIKRLVGGLHGIPLFIQQSNGGMLRAQNVAERAIYTLLSGPAGGVHGAHQLAAAMGIEKIITFDMGGTSTDVSLRDRAPVLTRDQMIDGYPVRIQMYDIHTVGAGGGSLAHIDSGGLLQVGPRSAGADPGPVCYGRGDQLTVTDANLFLGRLLADQFLGGTMPLDPGAVEKAMSRLAARLDLGEEQVALGIIRIVNAGMVKAIRAVSLEKGHDPKDFALCCFGGAAGLHCCELARELDMHRIIIPARAGILSAQGMVFAEPVLDFMETLFLAGEDLKGPRLAGAVADLAQRGLAEVDRIFPGSRAEGQGAPQVNSFLNLRYQGQSYELTVPYQGDFIECFHQAHEQAFSFRLEENPLELVSIQCAVRLQRPQVSLPPYKGPAEKHPTPIMKKNVQFADGAKQVPVYRRGDLAPGSSLTGRALIVDDYTTILVTAEYVLEVDGYGNILLTRIIHGHF
jgi:N-methylhydantoinase A